MTEPGVFDFRVFSIISQGLYVYPMDFNARDIYDACTLRKVNEPSTDCSDYVPIEGIVRAIEGKIPVICKREKESPKVIYCDREKNYYDDTGRCLNCYREGDELIKIKVPASVSPQGNEVALPEEPMDWSFDLDCVLDQMDQHRDQLLSQLPGSPMVQAYVNSDEKVEQVNDTEQVEQVNDTEEEEEDNNENTSAPAFVAFTEENDTTGFSSATKGDNASFMELFKTMEQRIVELEHTVEEQRVQINHMKQNDRMKDFDHMKFIVETFLSRAYKIYPIPLAPSNFFEQLPGDFVEVHQYYDMKKDGAIVAERMEPLMQPLVASAREGSNNRCLSFKTKDDKRYYIRTMVNHDKYFPVAVYNSDQYAKMKGDGLIKDSLECESLNELLTPQELASGKKYHFVTLTDGNSGYACA